MAKLESLQQDPIPKLKPEVFRRQVRFLVEESVWAGNGEEARLEAAGKP